MQLRFRVHSVTQETVMRPAQMPDGRTIEAGFAGLCVELVEIDGPNAQTLRLVPDDITSALGLFAEAGRVTLTIAQEAS